MDFKILVESSLGAVNDQAKLSEILVSLSDGINETLATNEKLTGDNAKLLDDNEKLRDTNHRLFLKIGSVIEPQAKKPDDQAKPEKLTLKDLFDERGELK